VRRILAAGFLVASSHTLLLGALPLYLESRSVAASTLGVVVGAYAVSAGLFRFLGSGLVDRLSSRVGIRVAALLCASGFSLMASLPAGPLLVVPRLLHGVGLAWFYTTALAWIANHTDLGQRGRSMGLFASTTGIAFVTMPSLGLLALQRAGATALFVLCALLALTVVPLAVGGKAPREATGGRLRLGTLSLPLAVVFLAAATLGSLEAFLPLIAAQRAVTHLVPVFVAFGLSLAAGRFFGGSLCDRIGALPVGGTALAVVAAAMAGVAVASGTAAFAALAATYGVAVGAATTSMLLLVSQRTPSEGQGRALGIASLATDIGTAVGAAMAGALVARAPLEAIPLGAAAAALVGAALSLAGRSGPSLVSFEVEGERDADSEREGGGGRAGR
jgi:MFS family permease